MNFKIKILFASLALAWSNCYEPVEGCLDIEATNFKATADENCCCEYPKVIFTIDQNWGDSLVFRNDGIYPLPSGETFQIRSISFYLSDFQFIKNGKLWEVSDTVHLQTFPDGSKTIFKNDFQLVRRSPEKYTIGELVESGEFEKLSFRFGLSDEANRIQPENAPENHPLGEQAEKLWESQPDGYRFLMLAFKRGIADSLPTDTIYFLKKDLPTVPLEFSGKYLHPLGYNFDMKMKVDYQKWFENVVLSADDNQSIKAKIVANLRSGFDVSQ